MLTTLLGWISILSSWTAIEVRVKEYYVWFLVLQTGMLGVFMALDFFLFFVFWEAMLVPMYLLIGIWGGPRKLYAAIKFFLYTLMGSVLMLLGILFLYFHHYSVSNPHVYTFSIPELYKTAPLIPIQHRHLAVRRFLYWVRDQSSDVPVPHLAAGCARGSAHRRVRHPGGRSPEDGNVRICPLLAAVLPVSRIASRSAGMGDRALADRNRLRRASFADAEGYEKAGGVLVGQSPWLLHTRYFRAQPRRTSGSVLQQINHGISTGALFLIVGILYERRHTREIAEYGGISNVMPIYATITMIMFLSSMGLPLLNGFVGEFTILQGAFTANWKWAAWAAPGVVLAAAYLLWLYQRVFFGTVTNPKNEKLHDLTPREVLTFVPLIIMAFWIGLYPKPFFQILQQPVNQIVQNIHDNSNANAPVNALVAPPPYAPPVVAAPSTQTKTVMPKVSN